jgi:probable F420-dependent oxidoreductase
MPRVKLGLALPHYDTSLGGKPASIDAVLRVAQRAEQAGLDSVWVSDHLFLDWSKYGGPTHAQGSLECWTTMTAVAATTERLRVGPLVLCNDFRNPALLAKMAATLDVLCAGRLDLCLGAGWYEPEYRAAGIDFAPTGIRIRRMGEAVEIVRRLLDGEELTLKGEHYTIDGAICRPVRENRPPVFVGGKGNKLLRTAARVADGWNFSWLTDIDTYRERVEFAERACEQAGRDPKTFRRSVGAYVVAGSDADDARRRFERLAERTPSGVLAGVSWDEFRRGRVAGAIGEVAERLAPLAELGVEEIIVTFGAVPFQLADEDDIDVLGDVAAAL